MKKKLFIGVVFLTMFIIYNSTFSFMNIEIHNKLNMQTGYGNCNFETNGEVDVIRDFIKDGDIVFDVGANKGEWSQSVYQYHKKGTIYSFEPLSRLNSLLKKNLKSTGTKVFCLAMSDICGELNFIEYQNETTLSSFYDRPILQKMPHHTVKVLTTTLDIFCKEYAIPHIDFLKIDTEGNEYKVLLGAQEMLQSGLIKKVQFEYGGTYTDSKTTLKQVFDFLIQHDFKIYRIAKNLLIHIDHWDNSLENYGYSNYLACRE